MSGGRGKDVYKRQGLEGADDFSLLVEKLAPLHLAAVGDECRELLERLNPLLDLLEHFRVDRGDRVDRKYPDQAEAMLLRFDVTISRLEVDIRNIEPVSYTHLGLSAGVAVRRCLYSRYQGRAGGDWQDGAFRRGLGAGTCR